MSFYCVTTIALNNEAASSAIHVEKISTSKVHTECLTQSFGGFSHQKEQKLSMFEMLGHLSNLHFFS